MLNRQVETLLDATTLTASWTENEIDVSACVGVTIEMYCATEQTIDLGYKFAQSGTYASPVEVNGTGYARFLVNATAQSIWINTVGKEKLFIQTQNSASISDVTVRIEKVIA